MTEHLYNQSGNAIGFRRGKYLHDMRGNAIGQINGTHVHKLTGSYVGELDGDMVLNKNLGNFGNIGNPGNPETLEVRATKGIAVIGDIPAIAMSLTSFLSNGRDGGFCMDLST